MTAFEEQMQLVRSMIGRTVMSVRFYDDNPGRSFGLHEVAELRLDNGDVIQFAAWGYDEYGVTVDRVRDGEHWLKGTPGTAQSIPCGAFVGTAAAHREPTPGQLTCVRCYAAWLTNQYDPNGEMK